MTTFGSGHIEQLPSGSFRVSVYAGVDPLTGKQLRHRKTVKTEEAAQIALGRLLEDAEAGRRPDTKVTVGELLARCMEVAELDVSTRQTYEGYIRRTILPALGSTEVRKVRGPVLDTFYTRLRRCGNLACNGRPFIEHTSFPPLEIQPGRVAAWKQAANTIRAAIRSGQLVPGEQLPSAHEIARRNGLRDGTIHHAIAVLAEEGMIKVQHGRRAVVSEDIEVDAPPKARRPSTRHDCARSRCGTHSCKPMSPATIRQIHAILSGAFNTAVRWEWIDRSPAASAKLPKARPRSPSSPSPKGVATVVAKARDLGLDLLALYLWLAAVTGARRGELCGLQWADLDLHPERAQFREVRTAGDFRAMWDTIERLWAQAAERAGRLPTAALTGQVSQEWSFAQTLRHLVFITDAWASRTVLDEEMPYHPIGLPQSWYPAADAARLGIDLAAEPGYYDILAARADRMAVIRRIVTELTDDGLGRLCQRSPAPGYPEEERAVAECVAVVMDEEIEHYRFAVRDLAVLESR